MPRPLAVLALAAALVPAGALACGDSQNTQAWWSPAEPQEATVADLLAWTKDKTAVAVDANTQATRESDGVIPGAVLLTSSSAFALKELPADPATRLVFYCKNELCGASHQAARRALQSGYTNVAVLPVGIKGWRAAGQKTARVKSRS